MLVGVRPDPLLRRFCQAFAEPPFAVISKAKAASLSSLLSADSISQKSISSEGNTPLSNVCILANNGRERGTYSYAYDARCRPFSILLPRKKPAILGRRTKSGTPEADGSEENALKVHAGLVRRSR